jgi:hypothetical protein
MPIASMPQELVAGAAHAAARAGARTTAPTRVIGAASTRPGLLDHGGGVDRHVALVGELVFEARRAVQLMAVDPEWAQEHVCSVGDATGLRYCVQYALMSAIIASE